MLSFSTCDLFKHRLSKATSGTPFHLTHYGDVNESGSVYSSHTCEREHARGCVIKCASVAAPFAVASVDSARVEIYRRPPLHRYGEKPEKKPEVPLFVVSVAELAAKYDSRAETTRTLLPQETRGINAPQGSPETSRRRKSTDLVDLASLPSSSAADRKDNRSTRSMTRNALKDLCSAELVELSRAGATIFLSRLADCPSCINPRPTSPQAYNFRKRFCAGNDRASTRTITC